MAMIFRRRKSNARNTALGNAEPRPNRKPGAIAHVCDRIKPPAAAKPAKPARAATPKKRTPPKRRRR